METKELVAWGLPLATGLLSWLYLNVVRNVITYEASSIQFPLKNPRYNPSDDPLGLITFESVKLKNRSIKSLSDVKINFDHITDLFVGKLHGSSIGKIALPEVKDGDALLVINEMPAGEIVTFAFLHRGVGALGGRKLWAGGNRYRIVEEDRHRGTVLKAYVLVAFSAAVALTWLWL